MHPCNKYSRSEQRSHQGDHSQANQRDVSHGDQRDVSHGQTRAAARHAWPPAWQLRFGVAVLVGVMGSVGCGGAPKLPAAGEPLDWGAVPEDQPFDWGMVPGRAGAARAAAGAAADAAPVSDAAAAAGAARVNVSALAAPPLGEPGEWGAAAPGKPVLVSSEGAVVVPAQSPDAGAWSRFEAAAAERRPEVSAALNALRRTENALRGSLAPAPPAAPGAASASSRAPVVPDLPAAPGVRDASGVRVVPVAPAAPAAPAARGNETSIVTHGERELAPWPPAAGTANGAPASAPHTAFTVRTGLLSDNVRMLVKSFGWQLKWPNETDHRIEASFELQRDNLEATLRRLLSLYEGHFVADLYQANRMVVVERAPLGVGIRSEDETASAPESVRRPRPLTAREREERKGTWLRFPAEPDEPDAD